MTTHSPDLLQALLYKCQVELDLYSLNLPSYLNDAVMLVFYIRQL